MADPLGDELASAAAASAVKIPPKSTARDESSTATDDHTEDDNATVKTARSSGSVVKDQLRMAMMFSAFKQPAPGRRGAGRDDTSKTEVLESKARVTASDHEESDRNEKAAKGKGRMMFEAVNDSDDAGATIIRDQTGAKRRFLSESDMEEDGPSKRRKPAITVPFASDVQGLKPAGMAMLDDGSFVMVYERFNPGTVVPAAVVKSEPPEILILSSGDEDETSPPRKKAISSAGAGNSLKQTPSITARSTILPRSTVYPGSANTVGKSGVGSASLYGHDIAHKGRAQHQAPKLAQVEKTLLSLAIPLWKVQQGGLNLFPTKKESLEWAETALEAAVAEVVKRGGTDAQKSVNELRENRELHILREISKHPSALLDSVIEAARAEIPIYLQNVFEGKAETVAWRVRRMLSKFNFIYDGYDWVTDERTIPRGAFLSPVMVAVMSAVWKEGMEVCGPLFQDMFDKMPLRMIAIWIYLKSWWSGVGVPVEDVFKEIDVEKTYEAITNNILQFENDKPELCDEMQRNLTARVRAHGVVGGPTSGASFIELD
ncbi:hypothetical protein CALCODRAFT_481518 [Calocera cornea HHB12733]|uniref:DUF6532 domain-containing protein n=1 Tax=Calocera cornea HHB12733 TaxID=1353952 RepID=A0A165HLL4_9BASI|nr:hypothetical protein CALCODRAFT_481518 [Calocera cornea HHB12733]